MSSGESISHPDTWPPRLVNLAKRPSRVAGFFVNQDDYLAFRGDTAEFRTFLDTCVSLSAFAPTTLHIHPGSGSFQPLDRSEGPSSVRLAARHHQPRWRATEPNPTKAAYFMELHVWLKGSVDISAVEIPSTVKTIREVDPEGAAEASLTSPATVTQLLNNHREDVGRGH